MKTVNIKKLWRNTVLKMDVYRSARDEYSDCEGIFMDANENPFGGEYARYPDPMQKKLRKAFAQEKDCKVSQVLFANGSDEWIDLLIRSFCEPHTDQVLYCPPTYGMYKVCADFNGVEALAIPQTSSFEIDCKAILDQASAKTKLLFLCSPNNPTGKSIPKNTLEKLIQHFPGMVVIDEAYIDFVSGKSVGNLLEQYANLIVLQTFSKARGMAGLRLGVILASEEVIATMGKVKLPYNVNQYTQTVALDSLCSRSDFRKGIEQLIRERERLRKALKQLDCIEKVFPSDANFLLIRCKNASELYQFLLQQNIVVRNRSKELYCENCLRVTIGSKEQNLALLAAIEIYIAERRGQNQEIES